MKTILVVDDEPGVHETLAMVLKPDYRLLDATDAGQALRLIHRNSVHLILLDIHLPGLDGLSLLRQIREAEPVLPVLMITAARTLKTAVEAMKSGANDYITKPFDIEELRLTIQRTLATHELEREVQLLRLELDRKYLPENLIGRSRVMRELFFKIRQLADTRTTILLTGESGTGKEMAARALHYNSARRGHPFVAINCASIPDSLIESELFGHEKGAFTDAITRKAGHFEIANGGTLFLDEIAELSPATQAKLLRVIQSREFTRVGGTQPVQVDVRLISATNRNLEEALRRKTFREDLYYRINVVSIHIPPLRERKEDIPLFVAHFLAKIAADTGKKPKIMSKEALAFLIRHDWPGNVRELENVVEQAVALSDRTLIGPDALPESVRIRRRSGSLKDKALEGQLSLAEAVNAFEREIIDRALRKSNYVQTRAARLLGITRRILKYKMDHLRLPTSERGWKKSTGRPGIS